MQAGWQTDTGRVRETNEDRVLVDTAEGIVLLADGMGGLPAGEVASALAIDIAHGFLVKNLAGKATDEELLTVMVEALFAAHLAVREGGELEPACAGMGTTLEQLVIRNARAFICHVGDSRVYRFRRELSRITQNHNLAGSLLRQGTPPAEIPKAYHHILTQAVGIDDAPAPQLKVLDLEPGDLLLVCSDGLTEMLDDDAITAILTQHTGDPQQAADALVAAANARGGVDNITVAVVVI